MADPARGPACGVRRHPYLGPDTESGHHKVVTLGSVVAAVIWMLASLGFAYYVDNFSSYDKTWGALAGVRS